jgi:TonB family protein
MRRAMGHLTAAVLLGGGAANAGTVPPPPPIVVDLVPPVASRAAQVAPRPQPRVVVLSYAAPPVSVRCRTGAALVAAAEALDPTGTVSYAPEPDGATVIGQGPSSRSPVELEFNVTAEGRVAGLRRVAPTGSYLSGHDEGKLQASVASWRFAPAAREGCRLTITTSAVPLEEADRLTLLRVMTSRPSSVVRQQVYKRANAPGDCYQGADPGVRVYVNPDWRRVPIPAGRKEWTALDYDIDPEGVPRNVRVADSSGNEAVNRASAEAVSGFRFFEGPRTGCRHYFWPFSTQVLSAPPIDKSGAQRPGDDKCPDNLLTFVEGDRSYPPAFKERGIEGWAVLRFSVAPWGEIGGIEVVRAEPSEMFGRTATEMLRQAKATPGERGYRGCAVPITFRIGDRDTIVPDAPEAP